MNDADKHKLNDQDCQRGNEKDQASACAKGCAGCGMHGRNRTATVWYIVALTAVVVFAILLSKIFA